MQSFMKKHIKFAISTVVLILVIISLYGCDPTDVAQLHIESESVEVDDGSGWGSAVDGMYLGEGDSVRTSDYGEASIILYESVVISLEPNTEVYISELMLKNIRVYQDKGSTWNKFTSLAGVKSLEVETPTTVATVRGTEFGVDVDYDSTTVLVGEGIVDVQSEGDSVVLEAFEKAVNRRRDVVMAAEPMDAYEDGELPVMAEMDFPEAEPESRIEKVELDDDDAARIRARMEKSSRALDRAKTRD